MAEAKPKRKINKPPSRKQLAARKKFIRMVKARAKAARPAKRARNVKHPPHSKLVRYAKRKKATAPKRKGKSRATKFVEAFIPAPIMALNPAKRGKQSYRASIGSGRFAIKIYADWHPDQGAYWVVSHPSGIGTWMKSEAEVRRFIADLKRNSRSRNGPGLGARRAEAFHGRGVRSWSTDKVSRHVPAKTTGAGLGRLNKIKVRTGRGTQTVNFGSRAKLVQVGPRHLAIANAKFRRPPATNPRGLYNAGQVEEVEYITDKPHLGHPKQTLFYHKHGEETGSRPCLWIDDEGYAIIQGGKMRIQPDGITD